MQVLDERKGCYSSLVGGGPEDLRPWRITRTSGDSRGFHEDLNMIAMIGTSVGLAETCKILLLLLQAILWWR